MQIYALKKNPAITVGGGKKESRDWPRVLFESRTACDFKENAHNINIQHLKREKVTTVFFI